MTQEILEEFGLNEKEAKIYLALLKEKSCTASRLAKLSKINRTTAYLELQNLVNLGLASYVIKDSKRCYQAAQPNKLVEILDFKKARVKSILPQLKELHRSIEPFNIETYEGKEGIKTFYQRVIENSKKVDVLGSTGKALEMLEFAYPHFVKKFIKTKLKMRMIANIQAKDKLTAAHPSTNFKIKYLPKEYKSEVTTVLYANKVAIQSLQENNIYVVIIKDKPLYESYKNYFEFMWNTLE